MPRPRFRDDQWERIYAIWRACPGIDVAQEPATRRFVEAVVWMARAGCAWRLVPDEVGSWNSVYKRFARWQEKGVWAALLEHLAADADREWVLLDRTVVRAHAGAAGAEKAQARTRWPLARRLLQQAARSRRRPWQPAGLPPDRAAGDAPHALPRLDRSTAKTEIADKADATDAILEAVAAGRALAVIPPKATRLDQRPTDWQRYRQRHQIETLFGFMKHYRRVFARFEKLARRYFAFVHLVAACILLR